MHKVAVPKYKLFGERALWPTPEPVHHETIAARSALHHWEISVHSHDSLLQILFLRSGAAEMTLETELATLHLPCVVLVPPGHAHGFRFSPDIEGQIVSIPNAILGELLMLSPDLLARLASMQAHALANLRDDLALLTTAFRLFAREYEGKDVGRLPLLMSILTQVLVWLARAAAAPAVPAAHQRFRQRLQSFHRLVDRHFSEWQPVRFYADRLGVSPAQLNNTCRRESGHSAQQVIHERILLEAKRLLAYSDLDVTSIAYALGFEDPAYFTRFFARKQGSPPSAFRVAHRP
jgi:AraC family transcriptional activator of pobA